MYARTAKAPSSGGAINAYLCVVEAYRDDDKVKQRIIADLGRRDLLATVLPNLRRILDATTSTSSRPSPGGPRLVAGKLFEELGL